MFRFWPTVVEPLLEAARPAVIVEVGAQGGLNTQQLLDFARRHQSIVHVIDPAPTFDVEDVKRRYGPHFVFHAALSLEILGELAPPDAVLIDGDHNWYTVSRELRLLAKCCERSGQAFPLTLLHDVGWPYGRRDLYYDPQTIPAGYRQPYERAGLIPAQSATVSEGGVNGHLHNADHEGGPRNGVLTAIEDCLPELPGAVTFISVPGGHGLGILLPEERMGKAQPLRECGEWLQSPEFLRQHLEWLEAERLQGLVRISELQSRLADARAHPAELDDEHVAAMSAQAEDARRLGEALAIQQRFAEQLVRQSEDLAGADELRHELTVKTEKLEAAVLARDEQLRLSAQRAQQFEDARDRAVRAQEAANLELGILQEKLRVANDAREAGADELRRRDEALSGQAHQAEELQGRLADVRGEMRESATRWEDERAELKRRLDAGEEAHNLELATLQRELDSARRRHAWATEEAAAANRQLTLLQDRERQLAQYAKQLEAQVADGDHLAQEAQAQAVLSQQTLHTIKREIDRARESRSWRFGHWVMQALRLLSFRPSRGTDALEKASGRVALVLSLGPSTKPIGETPALDGGSKADLLHGDVSVASNGAPSDGVESRSPRV